MHRAVYGKRTYVHELHQVFDVGRHIQCTHQKRKEKKREPWNHFYFEEQSGKNNISAYFNETSLQKPNYKYKMHHTHQTIYNVYGCKSTTSRISF